MIGNRYICIELGCKLPHEAHLAIIQDAAVGRQLIALFFAANIANINSVLKVYRSRDTNFKTAAKRLDLDALLPDSTQNLFRKLGKRPDIDGPGFSIYGFVSRLDCLHFFRQITIFDEGIRVVTGMGFNKDYPIRS